MRHAASGRDQGVAGYRGDVRRLAQTADRARLSTGHGDASRRTGRGGRGPGSVFHSLEEARSDPRQESTAAVVSRRGREQVPQHEAKPEERPRRSGCLGRDLSPLEQERAVHGADLRRAIARLEYDDRLAVVLYFYLDMPVGGVATAAGQSVAAKR